MAFTFNPITGELDIVLGTGTLDNTYLRLDASNDPVTGQLDLQAGCKTDTIDELTSDNGVTIDGLNIKTGTNTELTIDTGYGIWGDSGTAVNTLNSTNDFLYKGDLEVQGRIFGQGIIQVQSALGVGDERSAYWGAAADFETRWKRDVTIDSFHCGIDMTNNGSWIYTAKANLNKDHDQASAIDPTFYIFSATDPDTDNTEWISFKHDRTDAEILVGKGDLKITANITGAGAGHDQFSDFVAAEHLLVGAIDHNLLLNYVANEHIDWTAASDAFSTTGTVRINAATSDTDVKVAIHSDGTDFNAINISKTDADSGGYLSSKNANEMFITGGVKVNAAGGFEARATEASLYQMANGIHVWYGNTGLTIGNTYAVTPLMRVFSTGQLTLPITGSAGGILIGGDAQIYRSAADILYTPDKLTVNGGEIICSPTTPGQVCQFLSESNTNDWIAFFSNTANGPAIHWEGSSVNDLRFGPSTTTAGAGFTEEMRIVGATGQVQFPTSGSAVGLLIGGDWQIYRTAANQAVIPVGDKLGFGAAPTGPALVLADPTTYNNTSNTIQMGAGAFMAGRTNQTSLFEFSGGCNYYQAGGWKTVVGSTTATVFSSFNGIMYWATDSGLTSDTSFTPTTNMTLNTNGQLGIPTTGNAAGILLGGDVLLYRSAANQLLIPDAIIQQETSATLGDSRYSFRIHDDAGLAQGIGGGIGFGGTYTAGGAQTHWAGIWGYKENATSSQYGGQLHFGARVHGGNIASDLILDNNGDFEIARGDLKITTGDLNHDGTNIGFYGTTPAPQSAAYTITNEVATRTMDANSTTLNEVADVLGTLIEDLKLTGIIG